MSLDQYRDLVRDDAREVAKRTLRYKFGRLSNRRIVGILRPAAQEISELQSLTDAQLLDEWFLEFTRIRIELQQKR
jgi:hypothetical protein